MAWRKSPQALIALFDRVLAAEPRLERRQMFGYPAGFVNGHLCAGLHQESFLLRLGEADRRTLLTEDGAAIFEPMAGRPMREHVVLPDRVLGDAASLRHWVGRAVDYVAAMPPKQAKPRAPKRAARKSN